MTHSSLDFIYPVYLMQAHQRYFWYCNTKYVI